MENTRSQTSIQPFQEIYTLDLAETVGKVKSPPKIIQTLSRRRISNSPKIVSCPSDVQCFVSEPADGDGNDVFSPIDFVRIKDSGKVQRQGITQDTGTGILMAGVTFDKFQITLSAPMQPETLPDGRMRWKQLKGVEDLFNVYTLIECEPAYVSMCNCNTCDKCCGTGTSKEQRFFDAVCLGTVGFCECGSGDNCRHKLVVDPASAEISTLYVAPCTAPSAAYRTRALFTAYNCCNTSN